MTTGETALYTTIALGGNQWTIHFKKDKSENSTTSSTLTGYGQYPAEEYPGIPVVRLDLVGFKTALKFTSIPDDIRPQEETDIYSGMLETFLNRAVQLGIPVDNWDITSRKSKSGALYYVIPVIISHCELYNMAVDHIVKITQTGHVVVRSDHYNLLTRQTRGMEANTLYEWNFIKVINHMPVECMETMRWVP